jgi:ABC-type transport system substrate-binding protein
MVEADPELAAEFDALIEQGAALTTVEERRPIYEELQLKAQEEAVVLWAYQQTDKYHYQDWMVVPYVNVAYPQSEYA